MAVWKEKFRKAKVDFFRWWCLDLEWQQQRCSKETELIGAGCVQGVGEEGVMR